MSRICDFCDRSEHEVEKMAEIKAEERARKSFGSTHICLDCAKCAVDAMSTMPSNQPGGR